MNKTIGPLNPEVMGTIGKNLDKEIFNECKTIINTLEKFVYATLRHHKDEVIAIAKSLLENETINYEKIKQIVPDKLENSMCVQDLF
jgi:ATP-dependent Zn protease